MRDFLFNDINSNIKEVEIDKIIPFADNPFKEYSEEKLDELVESISQNGLINPIILWQKEDEFIILSGHNRVKALKKMNYIHLTKEMFKIYNDISEEEAKIIVVESNLMQRKELLPSEKAFAYKMKINAMNKQGERNDLTSSQVGTQLRSDKELAEQVGESRNSIQRYIRLTYLIKPLLSLVDEQKLPLNIGVELSYLKESTQLFLLAYFFEENTHKKLSIDIAKAIKEKSKDCEITKDILEEISASNKPKVKRKIEIKIKDIKKAVNRDFTSDDEVRKFLFECIEFYHKNNKIDERGELYG